MGNFFTRVSKSDGFLHWVGFFHFFLICFLFSCQGTKTQREDTVLVELRGEAQGTTYLVKYIDTKTSDYQDGLDSILKQIDRSLSTYDSTSQISLVNQSGTQTQFKDTFGHFLKVFNLSQQVHQWTEGAFDPTVKPLFDAWGFATKKGVEKDPDVPALLNDVGMDKMSLTVLDSTARLIRLDKGQNQWLDFNAVAQGYSVDLMASFLQQNGIEDFMIELGGEMRIGGTTTRGTLWRIGIDAPNEQKERKLDAVMQLSDLGVATSGNYRNFYERNGKKYAHILDPQSGYPVQHNLLSATVFADDAATADAFATAFMVMGLNKSRQFIEEHPTLQLDAYFIYANEKNGELKSLATGQLAKQLDER